MADEFEVKTRPLQGDSLSPVLFNITLEMIIMKTQKIYGRFNLVDKRRQCGIVEYKDDIIILRLDSKVVNMGTNYQGSNNKL